MGNSLIAIVWLTVIWKLSTDSCLEYSTVHREMKRLLILHVAMVINKFLRFPYCTLHILFVLIQIRKAHIIGTIGFTYLSTFSDLVFEAENILYA